MKKIFKITGITLIVILFALIAIPFLFKGKIIEGIKKEANKSLNAEFNFDENAIGLSLIKNFPNVSLTLERISIVGKDSFKGDTLVYLPKINAQLDLMSFFKGSSIKINKIALTKPYIQLLVLKNGKSNWDIAIPDTSSTESDTSSMFDIKLKKLSIENGILKYSDESLGFYTSLYQFNHELKGDFNQDNFLLETITEVEKLTMNYGGVSYLYNIKSAIKANLNMDMKNMKFTFSDNDILLNDLNIGGEGYVDMNENDMDFDMVFNTKKSDFKTFLSLIPGVYSSNFKDLKATGKLGLSGYFKGKMTDELMPGFGLKIDIDNGQFKYPDLPKSLNNVFVNLNIDNPTGVSDATVIDLKRFDMVMAGEPFNAQLFAKNFETNPYIKGFVKGAIQLDEFRNFIPLDKSTLIAGKITSDLQFDGYTKDIENSNYNKFKASGNLMAQNFQFKDPEMLKQGTKLEALMSFSPQKVDIKYLNGTVGMSDFAVVGYLDNLFSYFTKDELLTGKFNLQSNYINANEFLTDDEVVKEPTVNDTVSLEAFDVPGNLDFTLKSQINKLVYDNLILTQLNGDVIIKEKQLMFNQLAVQLLGGSMTLNGIYDSHQPQFPFSNINFNVSSLDIIKTYQYFDIVKKLAPIAQYTQGLFNSQIKLQNNFNKDLSVNYPTVTGELQMGISGASLKNMPLLNQLASELKITKLNNLSLKDLNFKLKIDNGKVLLDSLKMALWPGANAKISGFSALDQSIQYIAKLSIPRKDFGEANTVLNSLTSQARSKGVNLELSDIVNVDVLISGFFAKPIFKISLADTKKKFLDDVKSQLKDEAELRKKAIEDEAKRRAEIQKQRANDSLMNLKQQAIDRANLEKQKLEEKIRQEKQLAEEKAKAEIEKAKQEAARKAKKTILDGIKK